MASLEDILRNLQQDKSGFSSQSKPSVVRRKDYLNNTFSESLKQRSGGSTFKAPEPTGWKGFVSDVLNNPIVKPAINALDVLSVPGRAVSSTVQEFIDAYDNNPNTRATFDDFKNQVDDPTFGFGRIVGNATDNKWVNRLIGFAGDVVLDPLTYLTLGGSKALSSGTRLAAPVASAEGRFALAGKLAELGASPEVIKAVARRGRSAVKDTDLLAKAGYNRAGVYWMGKRIPGSTRIGEATESAFTNLRVWSGDHIFKRVGDLFTPQDMLDMRRQLARGDVPTEDVQDFMNMILSRNEERAVEAAALREAQALRRTVLGGVAAADIAEARSTAYKYLDVGAPTVDQTSAVGRVVAATRDLFAQMHERVMSAAQAVDPDFRVGKVENYVPHMPSDKAYRWLSDNNNPVAVKARGEIFNVFDNTGSFKPRMTAGGEIGTYTLTQADVDGGIDALNAIYRRELKIDFDFYEKDLPTILDKYDRMYAGMQGKTARKKYLVEKGTYKRIEERLVTDPEIEEIVKARIKEVTSMRSKKQKAASKSIDDVVKAMNSIFDADIAKASKEIDDVSGPISKAIMEEGNLSYRKTKLVREVEAAKASLRDAFSTFQRNMDEAARTPIVEALDRRVSSLLDRIELISEEINILDFSDTSINNNLKPIMDKLQTLSDDIKKAEASESRIIKLGNVIAEHFESILTGTDVKGSVEAGRRLRNALNARVQTEVGARKMVRGSTIDDVSLEGLTSAEQEALQAYSGAVNQEWWRAIQGAQPLSANKVERYSTRNNMKSKLQELARGGGQRGDFGDTSGLEEMRAMGAAMLAWIDTMPDDIAPQFSDLKDELVDAIVQASYSSNYYKRIATKKAKTKGVVTLQNISDNFRTVSANTRDTLYSYFAAQSLLSRIFSTVDLATSGDELVPGSVVSRILEEPEYAALERYLGRFADDAPESVSSFDEIQELMGAVEPGQIARAYSITYSELETLLSRVISDTEDTTYNLTLRTGTDLDDFIYNVPPNVGADGVAAINISEYIARSVEYADGPVTRADIDDVLTDYFDNTYGAWWESFKKQTKDAGITGTGRVEIDLFPTQTRVSRGGRGQRSPLREAERRKVQTGQQSAKQAKENIANKSKELLAAVDDELRPEDVLSAEEAFDKLNSALLKTYFKTEVQYRYSNLVRQMSTENLIPDKDVYRLVVNTVAKDLADHSQSQISSYNYAASKVQEILDVIDGASLERDRLRGVMAAATTAEERAAAQAKFDRIPSSGDWFGREEELYNTVTKMLMAEGREGDLDWRDLVRSANGDHYAESLYAELRELGGAAGTSGIVNTRRKLNQALKSATDQREARMIQSQLDSLPSKDAINKARRDLLVKKLRPWYKQNYDPSSNNASFEMIYAALKDRKKINTNGGRLEPTASVREIRTWLETAQNNIVGQTKRVRKNYGWTIQASDPFIDVAKFDPGVANMNDLPNIHAASLESAARQLEIDLENFSRAEKLVEEKLAETVEAEAAASIAERELRELTRKGGRLRDIVPEEEVIPMRLAREIHDRVVKLKNSKNYLGAIERSELNELIVEMAKYSVRQDIELDTVVEAADVAAGLISDGVAVFSKKTIADPEELIEIERLKKSIDDITKIFSQTSNAQYLANKLSVDEFKKEIIEGGANRRLKKLMQPYINQMDELYMKGDIEGGDARFWIGINRVQEAREAFNARVVDDSFLEKSKLADRLEYGKLLYRREAMMKRLEQLTARNPIGGEKFSHVVEASATKKNAGYFTLKEGSTFRTSADVAAQYKRIAQAKRVKNYDTAAALERDLQQAMQPVAPKRDVLRSNRRPIKITPDDFRGLFDDVNERIVDVDDAGKVSEYTLRQVSLQKVSDILQMIKSGDFTKEEFINALSHTASRKQSELYGVAPDIYSSRVSSLESAWSSSKDKRLLDEISELESAQALARYRSLLSSRKNAIQVAKDLRAEARRFAGDVGQRGAPYGYKPFNIGEYQKFYTAEYDRIYAQELENARKTFGSVEAERLAKQRTDAQILEMRKTASSKAKRIPYSEPTVGVKGAQYRFSKSFDKLNGIFDDIKRTTNELYDPYVRFNELTIDGTPYSDAVRTIVREVGELRPPDQRFVKVLESAEKYVYEAETLRMNLAFLDSNLDEDIVTRYVYGSAGLGPDDSFPISAYDRRLEMAGIDKDLETLSKFRVKLVRQNMQPSYRTQKAAIPNAGKKVAKLEKDLLDVASRLDSAATFRMSVQDQYNLVVPPLRQRLENMQNAKGRIESIVENNPSMEQKYSELLLFQGEVEDLLKELGTIQSGGVRAEQFVNPDSVLNPPGFPKLPGSEVSDLPQLTKEYEKYLLVKANFLNSWHDFAIVDEFAEKALKTAEDLTDLKWGTMINKELDKGFTSLEQLGLPSFYASDAMYEISMNMRRMIQPEFIRGLNKFIGSYTGFIKAYLTASPGFVVRNTLGNSFMLVAAGSEVENLAKGLKLFDGWSRSIKDGLEKEFIQGLPSRERELLEQAVKASDASGYGRGQEAIAGWQPKRQVLKDNKYTMLWRNMNNVSEGSARFLLAYDSVAKGMDFNAATARVKKYLFDYVDVGSADESLRTIIPFWFWMSRNLPMQIANRWTNPRAYLIYDKLMKNLRDDREDEYLPSWMVTSDAVRLTDNMYLNMDLGFNRIEEELGMIGEPGKFLQKLNPALKVPVELMFDKRVGYSGGFSREGVQAPGSVLSPAVQALAALLGQSKETAEGGQGVSEKFSYAIQSLLPPLAQSERLLPATDSGKDRQSNALLGYLGVPLRSVSEDDRMREMMRQLYAQQNQ